MGFILYNIKKIIGAPMENFTVEFFEKEDGTFPTNEIKKAIKYKEEYISNRR